MFAYVLECVHAHAGMHMWRSEPVLTFFGVGPELELKLSAVFLSTFTLWAILHTHLVLLLKGLT